MARVTVVADQDETRTPYTVVNALITDYTSQTDTAPQAIAGDLDVAGALKKSGGVVEVQANKGQVNGYAGLGAGSLVPVAQLGSGTPSASTVLAGDGAWIDHVLRSGKVYNCKGNTFAATEAGVQAAIDDLYGTYKAGWVKLPYKPSTDPITIESGLTIGKHTHLLGLGEDLTFLDVAEDVNAITVSDANVRALYKVQGLTIDMNQMEGDAVHADRAGYAGLNLMQLNDLYIENVKAGQYGLYLKGWVYGSMQNIFSKAYGTAVMIEKIDGFNYGNSLINNLKVQCNGAGAVGLQILSGDLAGQNQAFNVSTINNLIVWGLSGAGSIGVDLDYCAHLTVNGFTSEQVDVAVDAYYCRNLNFYLNYIYSTVANSKGFYITGVAGAIRNYGGWFQVDGLDWDDDGSWGVQNLLHGSVIATPNLDVTLTDVVNCYDTSGNPL